MEKTGRKKKKNMKRFLDGFDLSGGEMSGLGLVLDKKLGFTLGFYQFRSFSFVPHV